MDCLLRCETQYNWTFAKEGNRFEDLFGVGEKKRGVTDWNKNEKCSREQYGGTAMMAIGRLAAHVVSVGTDDIDLGRWS